MSLLPCTSSYEIFVIESAKIFSYITRLFGCSDLTVSLRRDTKKMSRIKLIILYSLLASFVSVIEHESSPYQ